MQGEVQTAPKNRSRWRRAKRLLLLLALEGGVFLLLFTVAAASKLTESKTAIRTFVATVANGQFPQSDQYLAEGMRTGAFSQELSWFVLAGGGNFPGQDDIRVVTNDEQPGNGGNDRAEVLLKLQDLDRKPFEVALMMQSEGGRWIVLGPVNPMTADQYFNNGLALLKNGEPDRAVLEFHKGLLLDPANVRAHMDLGRAVHEQSLQAAARGAEVDTLKRYAETALFEFKVASALNPQSPLAHYYVGLASRDDDKLDDAINELIEAVRLDPKDAHLHKVLAEFLGKRAGPGDAMNAFDELSRACQLNDQESCETWNQMNQMHD